MAALLVIVLIMIAVAAGVILAAFMLLVFLVLYACAERGWRRWVAMLCTIAYVGGFLLAVLS